MDSVTNRVGLPDLEISWEVTCDVLLMRIPGSQERCSGRDVVCIAPPPKPESRLLA